MKVFLIWPGDREVKILIDKIAAAGHELLYWVCSPEDLKLAGEFKGTILHDHFEAWDGKPAAGVPAEKFPPAGRDLIEKFLKTESVALTMMNKRFDKLCVDERRHIYYSMLGYWNGVLDLYKPDAVVFATVPHTVYNYILYDLARARGLKTVMFENPWVSDRALIYNDYQEGSWRLKKALKMNAGKLFRLDDLSADLKNYYLLKTGSDPVPLYMKHQKKELTGLSGWKLTLLGAWRSFWQGQFFNAARSFIAKRLGPNLKKEYKKLQKSPDWSSKFVYLPLGYQPERTSSPQGGIFVDQVLMIEILSAALPANWKIYVKEHPSQWWVRTGIEYSSNRYPGYYDRIGRIKNVQLVPIDTSTFRLINNCQAVASSGGTAGWEGAMRNKPTLNFGFPWYKDLPGLFNVFDVPSTKDAFAKISAGFRISPDIVLNFLKSYDEATFHGSVEAMFWEDTELDRSSSFSNIGDSTVRELERLDLKDNQK
jgi:hypothetical protein